MVVNGKTVNLQIWDTAGQERFRTITTSYYRSADAIMLVFDLCDEKTFSNLEAWMEDVRLYSQKGVEIILIGNKCDLNEERVVEYKDAKGYADKQGFTYFETSAKTKINVDKAITKLTQTVYEKKISAMDRLLASNSGDSNGAGAAGKAGVSLATANNRNASSSSSSCPC